MIFSVSVSALTADEINKAISDYNSAIANENNRHISKLSEITSHYAYLLDLKNNLDNEYADFSEDAYKTQKAAIEKLLADYQSDLFEAENLSNTELIAKYTALVEQTNKELTDLETKWFMYSSQLSIYTEDSVKQKSETDNENALHIENLEKINNDYSFILGYIPNV